VSASACLVNRLRTALEGFWPTIALVGLLATGACGGATNGATVFGPSSDRCSVAASLDASTIPAVGATATITVASARECEWAARVDAAWITLNPTSGAGDATIRIAVGPNPQFSTRSARVIVNDAGLDVIQAAAPVPAPPPPPGNSPDPTPPGAPPPPVPPPACSPEIDLPEQRFDERGGTGRVRIEAAAGCAWRASADANWLAIVSPPEGSGRGEVEYRVEPNLASQPRSATITIGGRTHRVQQTEARAPAPTCSYQLDREERSFGPDGGTGEVRVQTGPGCGWGASTSASWIVLASEGARSGNGEVQYRVEPNSSTHARSGTITIAGRTHRVQQAGTPPPAPACSYELDPAERSFGPDGGTAGVRVRAAAGCDWRASSNATWIVISTDPASGGDGEVQYRVERNTTTQARNGTITIGGRTHRVEQGGAPPTPSCSYELDPQERSFGPDGGTAGIRVRASAGCDWSASSSASWIVIASNGRGNGTAEVQYRVESNSSAQVRRGTITIGGVTHRVEQSGVPSPAPTCSYELDPPERSFGSDGGTADIRVRAPAGCEWSASSGASWIVIVSGRGSGNGEVQYRIERNSGTQARTGTIAIGGRTHRIEQSGAAQPEPTCSYQVNPPERSFGPNGGSSEIRVRTQSGCRWSASANVSWIVITSTREGVGTGAIEYRVDPNTGSAARSGSVTVAAHSVRITQNAR
jgi:hypothetical protein